MKHGIALAPGGVVRSEDLPEDSLRRAPVTASSPAVCPDLRSLVDVERDHILQVLAACEGSQAEAARVLGIGRNTLWRKLRHYAATV